MLGSRIFLCTCLRAWCKVPGLLQLHAWCYVLSSSLAPAHFMLRSRIFPCTSTHCWCYASWLSLIGLDDAQAEITSVASLRKLVVPKVSCARRNCVSWISIASRSFVFFGRAPYVQVVVQPRLDIVYHFLCLYYYVIYLSCSTTLYM